MPESEIVSCDQNVVT